MEAWQGEAFMTGPTSCSRSMCIWWQTVRNTNKKMKLGQDVKFHHPSTHRQLHSPRSYWLIVLRYTCYLGYMPEQNNLPAECNNNKKKLTLVCSSCFTTSARSISFLTALTQSSAKAWVAQRKVYRVPVSCTMTRAKKTKPWWETNRRTDRKASSWHSKYKYIGEQSGKSGSKNISCHKRRFCYTPDKKCTSKDVAVQVILKCCKVQPSSISLHGISTIVQLNTYNNKG